MGISWTLFLIGHHPEVQRKIHAELDHIFGEDKDRYVNFEDLKQMKYLECAIKEGQRIYPSVPIISRKCEEPFQIGQKFALAEEKIVIGNILRHFTIKSLDQRDQVEIASEMVLRPRTNTSMMIQYLTPSGVLGLASCLLKGAALAVIGALLLVGVIAWIARRVQWQTYKHLKNLPHREEQVPFQGVWIMFKACSPPDSPISFSTMIFAAICGLHARFQRYGRHLIYLGFTPLLILYKAKYVEEILSSNKILAKGAQYNLLHGWLGTGLLTSSGDKWRSRRRLFTPAFHFKILEDFAETINAQSFILCNKLEKLSQSGANFDVVPKVTLCTLDIICETVMGTSISAQINENSPYVNAVNRVGELFLERLMRPLLQIDFIYNFTASGRDFRQCIDVIHSFARKVIEERKTELQKEVNEGTLKLDSSSESEFGIKRRRPFLDLLILEHLKNDKYITKEDMREEVDTFMFGIYGKVHCDVFDLKMNEKRTKTDTGA
ncbi:hypothetical protein MTO96_029148 [Rhipicephalus appendiculatus]